MPEDSQETRKASWLQPPALVALLTSAATAAVTVLNLTPPQQLLAIAIIVGVAVPSFLLALRRSRDRRSRLLDATKLELKASERDHLWGRDSDQKELQRFCEAHVIVILDGESGTGKSALVQAGLKPQLATSPLFPILVHQLGHWAGVRQLFADMVWNALEDDDKRRLMLSEPGQPLPKKPLDIFPELKEFNSRLGRRPLLIFDQLDEFVLENLSHFQSPGGGWISAKTLAADPFWGDLASLVCRAEDPVHCLFVVRTDMLAVSHSFAVASDVKAFSVGALDPSPLEAHLGHLIGPDVISNQQNGWLDLRRELVRDLTQAGTIPGQLAFGLSSIAVLERPTLAEYKSVGRLLGMEARYLDSLISPAAQKSGLEPDQVRCILARLASVNDETGVTSSQSLPLSVHHLAASCGPEERIAKALVILRQHRIVRTVFESTGPEQAWVLDHDYLCLVVAELALVSNRWRRKLKAAYDAFNAASPPWNLFRLASMPLQVTLGVLWLRGTFRYRELARFARLSLLNFAPLVVVFLLVTACRAHERAQIFKALLSTWALPVELYDVQSRLDTLTVPSCVNRFDWIASNITHLRIATARKPGESDLEDGLGGEGRIQFPSWLVSLDVSTLPYPLRSLQTLPRNLRYLNVKGDSQLASFTGVPGGLTRFAASGNDDIRYFSPLPTSLQCLELGGQHLVSLREQLPSDLGALTTLRLEGTNVASLRGLPSSLRSLDLATNTKLAQVDYLPPLLSELRIDATKIPANLKFPPYLKDLHLSRTSLRDLSGVPPGLEALTLSSVAVGDWKGLPRSLRSLNLINVRPPEALPNGLRALAVVLPEGDLAWGKLPLGLSVLRLSLAGVRDLQGLPRGLEGLAITNAILVDISGCPQTVKTLDLRGTRQLRVIADLPGGLESLNLMNSIDLERLENLPASLRFLNIAGTPRLARLPVLPAGLEELDISGSAIRSLKGLPGNLKVLTVSRGQLGSLDGLPRTVHSLHFVELPEDRDGPEGSHFSCDPSEAPFERWHCVVRK